MSTYTYSNTDDDTLTEYLKEIDAIPLLTREEETALAQKAHQGNAAAKKQLTTANLRFVVSIAKNYQNRGLDMADLISEGNIGLMLAADRFDPSKGCHFITYAVWWIRQSIVRAIGEKSRAIRLPLNRVNDLERIERSCRRASGNMMTDQEIVAAADKICMDRDKARNLVSISRAMISLDAPVGDDDSFSSSSSFIADTRYGTPDSALMDEALKADIKKALHLLTPNEAAVITMRFGLTGDDPMSLQKIGTELDLTKERIRQIAEHALIVIRRSSLCEQLMAYAA